MDCYIIGSEKNPRVREVAQRMEQAGDGTRVHVLTEADLPDFGPDGGAVIIFEDEQGRLTEWVSKTRERTRYLNVPIVVVRSRVSNQSSAKLAAVGATAVCESDCPNDRIAVEVRARLDVRPVMERIRDRLLAPFTRATTVTMQEMCGTAVTVRAVYEKLGYRMFGDISAVLGLTGKGEGSFILSFPEATATALAKRALASVEESPEEGIIRDCIGEIANVVAGQARGLLANTPYQFGISTPTIVSGAHHEIRHKPGTPCLVIAFTSDVGDFALQLCLAL